MSVLNQTSQDKSLLVSIIIVSYNSEDELPICLDSIREQNIPCEVFIVDNASTDNSKDIIRKYSQEWLAIKPIFNTENKGLAYANNQPMDMATGKYILILNPDTILQKGSIELMANYLDAHTDVGVVGPKNLFENGIPHVSYHHNWTVIHIILWKMISHELMRCFYDRFSSYKEEPVLFVSGSCLMIKNALFAEIGGYDEQFFLSVEDVADLCFRVKQLGYQTVFYPNAKITHIGGKSHEGLPFLAMYHSFDGSLYFLKKHKSTMQFFFFFFVFGFISIFKAIYILLLTPFFPKRYKGISKIYFAIVIGLTKKYLLN